MLLNISERFSRRSYKARVAVIRILSSAAAELPLLDILPLLVLVVEPLPHLLLDPGLLAVLLLLAPAPGHPLAPPSLLSLSCAALGSFCLPLRTLPIFGAVIDNVIFLLVLLPAGGAAVEDNLQWGHLGPNLPLPLAVTVTLALARLLAATFPLARRRRGARSFPGASGWTLPVRVVGGIGRAPPPTHSFPSNCLLRAVAADAPPSARPRGGVFLPLLLLPPLALLLRRVLLLGSLLAARARAGARSLPAVAGAGARPAAGGCRLLARLELVHVLFLGGGLLGHGLLPRHAGRLGGSLDLDTEDPFLEQSLAGPRGVRRLAQGQVAAEELDHGAEVGVGAGVVWAAGYTQRGPAVIVHQTLVGPTEQQQPDHLGTGLSGLWRGVSRCVSVYLWLPAWPRCAECKDGGQCSPRRPAARPAPGLDITLLTRRAGPGTAGCHRVEMFCDVDVRQDVTWRQC